MMNKLIICSVFTLLLGAFLPQQASASTPKDSTALYSSKPTELIKTEVLMERLQEIKALDKSDMRFAEKQQLRKETRSIKKELQQISNGGIYLSTGAVILIVLLLIILL
jgi:hypothetical protein